MLSWIKAHMGWLLGLLFLIVICIFLLYSWLNTLVSLDYARQEREYQRAEIEALQSLLLEMGKRISRSEIERLITGKFGNNHMKKEGEGELSLDGGIILKFEGESLIEVKSLNE